MKKISVIGVGRLGICWGITLEKAGYKVLGVDLDKEYVASINDKTLTSPEPGVEEALKASKNFKATTSLKEAVKYSDVLFILVATPSLEDGKYDHSQVDGIIGQLAKIGKITGWLKRKKKHFVVGCTVMPGYCDSIKGKLSKLGWVTSYSPEFIAQGSILTDQKAPDIVLIGAGDDKAGAVLAEINQKIIGDPTKIVTIHTMSPLSAEITKLALNCYVTTKIAFANSIGDLAITAGGEYNKILKAIGCDSRIGGKALGYGFGYGGNCFPRDGRALRVFANKQGVEVPISEATDEANKAHLEFQVKDFIRVNPKKDKPITIMGVAYKIGAVIIEESQQLAFAVRLVEEGYKIVIQDRGEVINAVREIHGEKFGYEVSASYVKA